MKKWNRISTQEVFNHKYFKVNKDIVELPDGRQIEWLYWDSNDLIMVAAMTDDKKLVMIRQYRYLPDCEVIEFPAGRIEGSESIKDAAMREFEEETGYGCSGLVDLGAYYQSYSQKKHKIHLFFGQNAEKLENPRENSDEVEDIKVDLITLDKAVKMVTENKIIGTASSLAVFLVGEYLKNNLTD